MKVFISGGTGLIGQKVARLLHDRGDSVVIATRSVERARSAMTSALGGAAASFEYVTGQLDSPLVVAAISHCEAVVSLAGESVFGQRWNADFKRTLRSSRVELTDQLVKGIELVSPKPRVLVSASGVGYYGDRAEEWLEESAAPGTDFLADLCKDWEATALRANTFGVRVVLARFAIVLSAKGGALERMLPPFKLGVGGPLGSGNQFMAWIHADDAARAIVFAIDTESLAGPMNVASPEAVTNAEFSKTLGSVLHRPAIFSAPRFALAAMLSGEGADAILASQRARPTALVAAGFDFTHPELRETLSDVVAR